MFRNERTDQVTRAMNIFLRAKNYTAIDHRLRTLRLVDLSCEEMLAYLKATRDVAHFLTSHTTFFEHVRKTLVSRGHMRHDTLNGCWPGTPGGICKTSVFRV